MTIIKETDLFVVNRGDSVYNYSGLQFKDDINLFLADRDVKVWVQDSPPPTPLPPDYASQKDLWFDTSIGAFFIGALDESEVDVIWIIVNPADHRQFLDVVSGEVKFPQGIANGQVFVHPNTGVKYYFKAAKSQWMDKDLPGLDTFVLREGDTMTGALQLPNLIVTGDDSVEAHIELNEGILTADDSVVGEEQRLYWNGDTVAKHEDVVRLANTVVNIDQHIENITPYTYRGLLEFSDTQQDSVYSLYKSDGDFTDDHSQTAKIYLADTSAAIDVTSLTKGMYVEVQNTDGVDVLTGKVLDKAVAGVGIVITLDVTRSQGTSVLGVKSHVRIFKVADSSDKPTVYFQPNIPDEDLESVKPGQLWVDSSTNIQYIWTGKEWSEVGAACGSGSSTEIPVATIWPYAGSITADAPLPRGWMLCDGSDIPPKYVRLITALGGDPDSGDTYKTPDLRGRYLGGASTNSNSKSYGLGTERRYYNDYTRIPRTSDALFTIDNKNLGNHSHGTGNLKAEIKTEDGNHTHFIGSQGHPPSGNSNKSNIFKAMNNDGNSQNNIRTGSNDGKHKHTITMSGSTASDNLGNHTHGVTMASEWDSYTRPYTYTVHWIIKHD